MKSIATLGAGCFWCIDAILREVKGVESVVSGYSGDASERPTYEQIHNSPAGNAEVVQVTFDDSVLSYEDLLKIFYATHDPTTLNRQNYDIGEEYRSIIFYHDDTQKEIAEKVTKEFAPTIWSKPIVTQIEPFNAFWPAEDYHQDFYNQNPNVGYCQVIINPKLRKFRQEFASKLKS